MRPHRIGPVWSDGIYHRELMMGGPYWENPSRWILTGENSCVFDREVRARLEPYLLPASPATAVAGR